VKKSDSILVKIIGAVLTILVESAIDKICEPKDEDEEENEEE